jgi:hypothetical protein
LGEVFGLGQLLIVFGGCSASFFLKAFGRELLSLDFASKLAAPTLEALDLLGNRLGGQGSGNRSRLEAGTAVHALIQPPQVGLTTD